MQKILFISAMEGYAWGGSEYLWAGAAERLAHRGVQVITSVKCWGKSVRQIEHLRSLGCRIILRPKLSLARRLGRNLFPGRDYARHVRKIGTGADLIVVSQGSTLDGFQWMEAARANGYRYAVIVQAAAEQWWPEDDIGERLAECYEGAAAAYFVSETNLALVRRQCAITLPRGRVVRNPFNVRYDARPAWPADSSEGLSLACVGRLETVAKGQDLLVEVLNRRRWRERNVHVSLVGNGLNERGLRRLVDQLKLSSIEFAGFVNDIEGLWSKHHALVLPSRFEGMPLATVEAMLCGRPCIVTDVAGHRELVRDGINGFLAKAPTVELLDEAMNRAWENRHRLKEMGETAAIDVRKWVSADPIEDFVHELDALVEKT